MARYNHLLTDWPSFSWNDAALSATLGEVRYIQGIISGRMQSMGFSARASSSKWAKMAKCSQDTATRDINDLMEKGMLRKSPKGGRSTRYELVW